jgi:hypothetical protein
MQWTLPVGLTGGVAGAAANLPVAIYANLVAWWDFEENSAATSFTDAFSGTHNLALINSKTTANDSMANGISGRAANWPNSSSSDGAQIVRSDTAFDFGDTGFTFGAWFNMRQEVGSDVTRFLAGRGFANPLSYAIYWRDLSPSNFQFEMAIRDSANATSTTIIHNQGAPINTNTWHFVVLGHDPAADLLVGWVDGVRQQANFANGPFVTNVPNFTFAQARNNDTTNQDTSRTIGHATDSAFVVNRTLNDAEVGYLYNSGAGFNFAVFANAAGH